MKLALIAAVILLFLLSGWGLHHLGYKAGKNYGQQKISNLKNQISDIQKENQAALDKAKKQERKAKEKADRLSRSLSAETKKIQNNLNSWMKHFNKEVSQCSVAKQKLCPGLQDY